MANTTVVYARINTELKETAEGILEKLGITPTVAIQMFYRQIVLINGMPFELRLPPNKPTAIGGMTEDEICAEVQKGLDSFKEGEGYTPEEVDRILHDKYGI